MEVWMKNKKIFFWICLVIFVVLIIAFAMIVKETGTKLYYSNILKNNIEIPRFSFFINEREGEDTYQLEFIMFGREEHIVEKLYKLYEDNDRNKNIGEYKFSQWAVNEQKISKLIVIVYEKL